MNQTDEEVVESLRETAIESYGETREEAIEALASFGPAALPALSEVAATVTAGDDLALQKIQAIHEQS
jgi:HEAT repeat protein